ncbi:hypothetical protein [Maritimibacter sp. 55A14]|nr:hypothetical protein [Maritimibacter sp. 55A14]
MKDLSSSESGTEETSADGSQRMLVAIVMATAAFWSVIAAIAIRWAI